MATPYIHTSLKAEQVIRIIPRYKNNASSHEVRAPLPTIPFSSGNEIDESFEYLKLVNKIAQSLGGARGISVDRGIAEEMHWKGITNQEFAVELKFDAYNSGKDDVVIPIKKLLMMATPEPSSIPGVSKKLWIGPPTVSIRFGNIVTLMKCWIKNVNVQFSNKLDDNFDPLSATVALTFIPYDPIGRYALKKEKGTQGINDVIKYPYDINVLQKLGKK